MDQLEGRKRVRAPGLSLLPRPSVSRSQRATPGNTGSGPQSESQLDKALQRSERIGDMLLAREDEELEKIQSLAEELIQREQNIPSGGNPCQAEADKCLQCYKEHSDNPVACSDVVNAYSKFAGEAAV